MADMCRCYSPPASMVMLIWHHGSVLVAHRLEQTPVSIADFLAKLKRQNVPRVPGTAVFLTRTSIGAPPLLWHLRHNRALHERVVVLRVLTEIEATRALAGSDVGGRGG